VKTKQVVLEKHFCSASRKKRTVTKNMVSFLKPILTDQKNSTSKTLELGWGGEKDNCLMCPAGGKRHERGKGFARR